MVEDIQKMINQMFSQMVLSGVSYMSNQNSSEQDVNESNVDSSIEEVEMESLEETNLFAMLPFHDEDCEQLDLAEKVDLFAQLPFSDDESAAEVVPSSMKPS